MCHFSPFYKSQNWCDKKIHFWVYVRNLPIPSLKKICCVYIFTTHIFIRMEKPLKQYLEDYKTLKISTERQTNKLVLEGFNNIILQNKDLFGRRSDGNILSKH